MNPETAPITETPTPAAAPAEPTPTSEPAGVPDGTVLDVRHSDGTFAKEVVVNELDVNGNVVGFHKEIHNA